jgi:hypothetical protein
MAKAKPVQFSQSFRQQAWQVALDLFASGIKRLPELRRQATSKLVALGWEQILINIVVPIIIQMLQEWLREARKVQTFASTLPADVPDDFLSDVRLAMVREPRE